MWLGYIRMNSWIRMKIVVKKYYDKTTLLLYKVFYLRKLAPPTLALSSCLTSAIFILAICSTTDGTIESLSRLKGNA
jgi:hypothetical protein